MSELAPGSRSQTTIRDIAREADVSVSTVSRVLNDHPHVDSHTREAVWKTASDLGYPLSRLRGPGAKPKRTIAFLTHMLDSSAHTDSVRTSDIEQMIVRGAHTVFETKRVATHIYKSDTSTEQLQQLIEASNIGGLIFPGGVYNRDMLLWLKEESIAFVTAGAHAHPIDTNAVMANYVQGMVFAVEHLVATRRKHICLINGPAETNTSAEKYKGFRLGLSLHGLPCHDYQTSSGASFDVENGYIATLRLLALRKPVDAIIYGTDGMAVGGLKALKESGHHIPRDVAVVGLHNYDIARFADPALTTLEFDMQMMGRLAAWRLCNLMDGADEDCHVMTVPTRLIVRDST